VKENELRLLLLERSIKDGTYRVNAEAIAAKLLADPDFMEARTVRAARTRLPRPLPN
jgi:hypothetical protein